MLSELRRRLFIFSVCAGAVLIAAAASQAAYIVTTNMNGADAEVREDSGDAHAASAVNDPAWVGSGGPLFVPLGTNRGTNTELATRVKDSTSNSGDNSSVMYLKFDISDANGVTNALLSNLNRVKLVMTTRNSAQQRWNRIHGREPYRGTTPANDTNPDFVDFAEDPANYTRVKFNVYGLQNFSHLRYNWSESGVPATYNAANFPQYGPEGSITWYNAPGITPDNRNGTTQDQGKWNFNSDMRLLGQTTLKDPGLPDPVPDFVGDYPPTPGSGSAAHCVGCKAFDFTSTSLKQLILDARAAGQTHITLAVHIANDAFRDSTGETAQVTPNDFLAFNYLFNPKEMDRDPNDAIPFQLNNDPSYNTDWTDVLPADNDGDGPDVDGDGVADNMLTGPGPYHAASNADGRFSPQLVFFVPEPSSAILMVIGMLAATVTSRRRK
jgi:hypothetical protein